MFCDFVNRYVCHQLGELNTSRDILNWFRKVSTFIFLDMILYAQLAVTKNVDDILKAETDTCIYKVSMSSEEEFNDRI